jgi:hypothetical protein
MTHASAIKVHGVQLSMQEIARDETRRETRRWTRRDGEPEQRAATRLKVRLDGSRGSAIQAAGFSVSDWSTPENGRINATAQITSRVSCPWTSGGHYVHPSVRQGTHRVDIAPTQRVSVPACWVSSRQRRMFALGVLVAFLERVQEHVRAIDCSLIGTRFTDYVACSTGLENSPEPCRHPALGTFNHGIVRSR